MPHTEDPWAVIVLGALIHGAGFWDLEQSTNVYIYIEGFPKIGDPNIVP